MYVSPGNPDSSSVTEIGHHDVTEKLHKVVPMCLFFMF
jgi:hypothetical protein